MSKMFFGGIPTAPEVEKLIKTFEPFDVGNIILHESIEKVLGHPIRSARYKVVTNAWRRKLLQHFNIELGSLHGLGLKVLSNGERIEAGEKGAQCGTRKILRSVKKTVVVVTDDPLLKRKQELLQRYAAAVIFDHNTLQRDVTLPTPTENLIK